jgi:3',5'-cyclic AMP phosphodiesterase CpdA
MIGASLLATPTIGRAAPLAVPGDGRYVPTQPVQASTAAVRSGPVTIVAAGDIACDPHNVMFNRGAGSGAYCRAAAVEKVIRAANPDAVLPLGDEQYDVGRLRAFRRSYDKSWGEELRRTLPVPGNHEYAVSTRAHGYFAYFGSRAGPKRRGWYSVRIGSWRLIALNSNCWAVGGCAGGTAQYRWLRHLLAKRSSRCSLAFMHHPLVSSGLHGDDESRARPLWKLLYRFGVDVALVGHDHIYERFAPVNAFGVKKKAHGIREFVVGTGGKSYYGAPFAGGNSERRVVGYFGVLALQLGRRGYAWRFVDVDGRVHDRGTARCR